ncbi:MAG TPA: hypothetical protein VK671_17005 [Mucilaginibacter sp.]|jgi:hypothetical protein|nr:hypothetical protein [Mucilaginibacter sp.]
MTNPFIVSFFKLIGSFIMLTFWAAYKVSKEGNKRRIIKDAILLHIRLFPNEGRALYGAKTDKFMKVNHPETVKFKDELFALGLRPIFIGLLILTFFYATIPIFDVLLIIVVLYVVLFETNCEEYKLKKWHKCTLIAIWIITYAVITYSEYQVHPPVSHPQILIDTLNHH